MCTHLNCILTCCIDFRTLLFNTDAACLYSTAGRFLNLFHWEPVTLHQSLDLSDIYQSSDVPESAEPCDLVISDKQLVCLHYS